MTNYQSLVLPKSVFPIYHFYINVLLFPISRPKNHLSLFLPFFLIFHLSYSPTPYTSLCANFKCLQYSLFQVTILCLSYGNEFLLGFPTFGTISLAHIFFLLKKIFIAIKSTTLTKFLKIWYHSTYQG